MKKPPANHAPISRAAQRIAKREVDYGAADRLLPLDAVTQIAGIGKTKLYELERAGKFPKRCYPCGGSSSRWSEREVTAWLQLQLDARPAA